MLKLMAALRISPDQAIAALSEPVPVPASDAIDPSNPGQESGECQKVSMEGEEAVSERTVAPGIPSNNPRRND
jgi:hypothetical protein